MAVTVVRDEARRPAAHPEALDLQAFPSLGHDHGSLAPGVRGPGTEAQPRQPIEKARQQSAEVGKERAHLRLVGKADVLNSFTSQ
jgi:hypothetical protein